MEFLEQNTDVKNLNNPTVSVCMPVFNRERMVIQAIQSALAQEVPGLEVVAVDDCSTDGAWEAMNKLTDARLRLFRNKANLGLFGNFNRCLELARGKYLRILCTDDRLLPGCLKDEVELMEENPSVVVLSNDGWLVNENGQRMQRMPNHLPPGIYEGKNAVAGVLWVLTYYGYNPLNFPSGILLRRDAVLKAGRFDESIRTTGDVEYWLRLLSFGNLAIRTEPVCEVMDHPETESRRLFPEGHYIWGQYEVARRYSEVLKSRGVYRGVLEQLSARSVWFSFKLLRMREPQGASLHWAFPGKIGVSRAAAVSALVRHIALRLRLRLFGTRLMLDQPLPYRNTRSAPLRSGVAVTLPDKSS